MWICLWIWVCRYALLCCLWYWGTSEIEMKQVPHKRHEKMEFTNDIVQIYTLENGIWRGREPNVGELNSWNSEVNVLRKGFNSNWKWFFNKLSMLKSYDAKEIYILWFLFGNVRDLAFTFRTQCHLYLCYYVQFAGLSFNHKKHPLPAETLQALICKVSINTTLQSLRFCTLWHKRWHFCQFAYAYAGSHSIFNRKILNWQQWKISEVKEICHSKLGFICLFWQSEKFIAWWWATDQIELRAHKFHDEWKLKTKQSNPIK